MKKIDIGKDFSSIIVNRDFYQGNGENTAIDFRTRFLGELDDESVWENDDTMVELDFSSVRSISTSFANELFAYYIKYAKNPKFILKKIRLSNLSPLKENMIFRELEKGYKSK